MMERNMTRTVTRSISRKTRSAKAVGKATLNKAAKTLERAATNYARLAGKAGVAAKKTAKKLSRSKTAKTLAAAALAVAGYAAVRAARKR
jgi:hypothetical protein